MNEQQKITSKGKSYDPKKPVLLYDEKCEFCRRSVTQWQKKTGQEVDYQPYQKALKNYPQLSQEQCQNAIQFINTNGKVSSGAHAVLLALSSTWQYWILLWLYGHIPFFGRAAENIYQWVSHHRKFFSRFF